MWGEKHYDSGPQHALQLIALNLAETRKILDKLCACVCAQSDNNAMLKRMAQMEERIMSAISVFAEKQNAYNDKIEVAVKGLGSDIAALNAKIEELQNTPGVITPEDQALLDAIEARSDTIAAKLDALDALTPPPPPAG